MEKNNIFMLLYKGCDMSKLVLYKNKEKVFEKEGSITGNLFKVENITFNLDNNILTREDDNFKYELDFVSENAFILIKEKNYSLNLLIKTKEINNDNKIIKIIYNIESDEDSENIIEIII